MSKLIEINEYLKKSIENSKSNYAVPKRWMPDNYEGHVKLSGRKFFVNPYEYFTKIIDKILALKGTADYSKPLSFIKNEKDSKWVDSSIMYSVHVRASVAYIHSNLNLFKPINSDGYSEKGTFLKMIAILPYLKKLNVNCIYLLPITEYSKNDKFKKGEEGSPYSVKNFFEVDDTYNDTLISNKFNANDEFGAFVEAAHIIGMRIMLDFVPRTCSRDNALILEHPEWFYWIDIKELSGYKPPYIDELGFEQPSVDNLPILYSNEEVKTHLKKFRFDPKKTNPEKWDSFVKKNKDNPDFFDELVKEFKVITIPGFSDWINDTQPPWDDITFLRMYMSHPKEAEKFINENQPPYILYDVIKSSLFPGEEKNEKLWNMIADIMPFYQRNYGIDGARLDMGHALPDQLEKMIISKAKEYDPAFAIIAEELNMQYHIRANNLGYDGILGNSWWTLPRIEEGWFKKVFETIMPELSLPAFSTSETPDCPRAVERRHGETFSKLSAVVTYFMPNGITFVNSGFEILEKQPMNTGLDFPNPMEERFKSLPPSDQFYGKLAFFDWYVLHWDTDHHIVKLLTLLGIIKKQNEDLISNIENYKFIDFGENNFVLFWWNGEHGVLIPVNLNFEYPYYYDIDLGFHTWKGHHKICTLIENYRRGESEWDIQDGRLRITINPGEARVFLVK